MKLAIYDIEVAGDTDGDDLVNEKDFRRSTRAILRGASLIKKITERNSAIKKFIESKRVAFVVGSSVGEIEVTRDFLKELATTNTARPFLFQLSSHNSTAGFLAQHFGLKGPTFTVSNQYQSAEVALEQAGILLEANLCDLVLVYCTEQVIEGWIDLKTYRKYPQLKAISGAALALIGRDQQPEFKPIARIGDFSYGEEGEGALEAGPFYDSNTLEKIAKLISAGRMGNYAELRPDMTVTRFVLETPYVGVNS